MADILLMIIYVHAIERNVCLLIKISLKFVEVL